MPPPKKLILTGVLEMIMVLPGYLEENFFTLTSSFYIVIDTRVFMHRDNGDKGTIGLDLIQAAGSLSNKTWFYYSYSGIIKANGYS